MLEPGYHCCYCSCNKISAMITKNTIRFNNPVTYLFIFHFSLVIVRVSIN